MHCHGCLVIKMSLIVGFDPTLTSLSRLDSLSFSGALLIPNIAVSIEEFGIDICIFHCFVVIKVYLFFPGAIINIILDMLNYSFPYEMYLAQSL